LDLGVLLPDYVETAYLANAHCLDIETAQGLGVNRLQEDRGLAAALAKVATIHTDSLVSLRKEIELNTHLANERTHLMQEWDTPSWELQKMKTGAMPLASLETCIHYMFNRFRHLNAGLVELQHYNMDKPMGDSIARVLLIM